MKALKPTNITRRLSAFLAFACALALTGADVTFAPKECVLWSTVTEANPSVSVFWPADAATASLIVSDMGVVTTNAVSPGATTATLQLARPTSPAEERVVEVALAFYDANGAECAGSRSTAKLAVALTGTGGEHARFATAGSDRWGEVEGKTALLPVPEDAAFDDLPCRWWFVAVPKTPAEFALLDSEDATLCAATLWRKATGFFLMVH